MILYMKLFFAKKIQTKYNESIIPENRIKKKNEEKNNYNRKFENHRKIIKICH